MKKSDKIELDAIVDEGSYATMAESVEAAEVRAEAGRQTSSGLTGRHITSCSFHGESASLYLDGDVGIKLVAGLDRVEWELLTSRDEPGKSTGLPSVLHLRFKGPTDYAWHWKDILDGLVGKRFLAIAPGEFYVSLFVEGVPDLLFMARVVRGSDRKLLFFDEE